MIVPIKKKNVYQDISDQIMDMIEEGMWKEGERIKGEMELAEAFHVSRGSIREAIKPLQLMGILEAKSGQGTFVSANAVQVIQDYRLTTMINDIRYRNQVLECRYMIEPQAAFVAAQISTDEDIEQLQSIYDNMMSASEDGNMREMNKWGSKFHSYIVSMMGNEVLMALYNSIEQKAMEEREEFNQERDDDAYLKSHEEHHKLIEAFKRHDADAARKIMDLHIARKLRWKKETAE